MLVKLDGRVPESTCVVADDQRAVYILSLGLVNYLLAPGSPDLESSRHLRAPYTAAVALKSLSNLNRCPFISTLGDHAFIRTMIFPRCHKNQASIAS